MIRITKPSSVPKILRTKGRVKSRANIQEYNKGSQDFDFDSKIYGHKSVKEALIRAQHDKCFLCESRITHITYGDVEHFRPKAGYRQSVGDALQKPGYYWLAFQWTNLFLACQLCNQLFKRNLFPVANPKKRAVSHRQSLRYEKPLFIDPSVDNPEQFISFRHEIPFPIEDNPRGTATIENLGLKRQKLNDKRLEVYEMLKMLYLIAYRIPVIEESDGAKTLLRKATQDSAEYASMIRVAVKSAFASVT